MEQAYKLSHSDRKRSDLMRAEAEELNKLIDISEDAVQSK